MTVPSEAVTAALRAWWDDRTNDPRIAMKAAIEAAEGVCGLLVPSPTFDCPDCCDGLYADDDEGYGPCKVCGRVGRARNEAAQ